jgi:hypothetical protein
MYMLVLLLSKHTVNGFVLLLVVVGALLAFDSFWPYSRRRAQHIDMAAMTLRPDRQADCLPESHQHAVNVDPQLARKPILQCLDNV